MRVKTRWMVAVLRKLEIRETAILVKSSLEQPIRKDSQVVSEKDRVSLAKLSPRDFWRNIK